ncbi:MAG: translation elongation factor Ts [Phycisphaeraceae bacterium]|nr:translation elongation factor Ts [Phycisphaerae bacterium]MBX3391231.1 translation elongation factor Ts [Phycisphaeraceae bacterium]
MAEISAKDVMSLRNRTGLSMMACKAALAEAGGDADKAEEILRKQLKGKMESRTDRAAGEGRVEVIVGQAAAAIVEVRAETDFTAKNDGFVSMVSAVAKLALSAPPGPVASSPEITAEVDKVRITTGENCSFARGYRIAGAAGSCFGRYVHHDGKTGVLLHATGDIPQDVLTQVCMHIVAADPRPKGVSVNDIPADVVEKERKFRIEQAIESGKPKEIAEKMVEGGMRKFYEEIALLEQPFVMDQTKRIKDLIGPGGTIVSYHRYQVGEQV